MKKLLLIIPPLLLLSACTIEPNKEICVRSHEEPGMVGKIPVTNEECDEWAINPEWIKYKEQQVKDIQKELEKYK